ncbi:MAG: hypothetical protein H0W41_06330 [Chloroflexi bacterium]|nr:hypothetical protein [Chloroflexota bacterium]
MQLGQRYRVLPEQEQPEQCRSTAASSSGAWPSSPPAPWRWLAWVVVPEASAQPQSAESVAPASEDAKPGPVDDGRTALLVGGGLVLVGLYFLVREYLPRIDWGFVWPLILVGIGALILVGAARRR